MNEAADEFISTHASAREATSCCCRTDLFRGFQLTPPHGRRQLADNADSYAKEFQLTPPHGRRPEHVNAELTPSNNFNSRLRTGGDTKHMFDVSFVTFQLTPPHGRRHSLQRFSTNSFEFQLTPPHGRRLCKLCRCRITIIFQLTPPHGRRHHFIYISARNVTFQPTLPHGGVPEILKKK